MRINVEYVHPPIPIRMFDWVAYDDDSPENGGNHGPTPAEAVVALLMELDEDGALLNDYDNPGRITVNCPPAEFAVIRAECAYAGYDVEFDYKVDDQSQEWMDAALGPKPKEVLPE